MRGVNSREYNTDLKYINTREEYILTIDQDITQCAYLPSVNPFNLLGYTFLINHKDTNQHDMIKRVQGGGSKPHGIIRRWW